MHDYSSASDSAAHPWNDVEALLERISQLAADAPDEEGFYGPLLSAAVEAVEGVGGILWFKNSQGALEPRYQTGVEQAGFVASPAIEQSHLRLVQSIVAAGDHDWLMPTTGVMGGDRWNPTTCALAFRPLRYEGELQGMLEIAIPAASADWTPGVQQVLAAFGLMAEDYTRRMEVRALRQVASRNDGLTEFALAVHRRLDVRRTAFTIANHLPRITACDRVMVFTRQGKRLSLSAVTGVSVVERRSPLSKAALAAAMAVDQGGEPVVCGDDPRDLAPEIDRAMSRLLDCSHARTTIVQPLASEGGASPGVLLVENLQSDAATQLSHQVSTLAPTAADALSNALEYESLPLLPISRSLRKWRDRWGWRLSFAAIGAGVLALAILLLIFVPVEMTVEAPGEVRPAEVVDLFAPRDATVVETSFDPEHEVAAEELLIQLRSDELDLAIEEAIGALNATEQKLTDIAKERLKPRRETEPRSVSELAAEENRLRQQAADQTRRLQDLNSQQDQLALRSPLGGRILTWDSERLLDARPVRRGQALLSIANTAGDWELLLRAADEEIGPVLSAQRDSQRPLRVTFLVQSDAERILSGEVIDIGQTTQTDEAGHPFTPITVKIDKPQDWRPRPGAQAVGKIHCGRASCGYVWFHDAYNAVRTWLLF